MMSQNSLHMQGMKTIQANVDCMQKGGHVGLRPGCPPPCHIGFLSLSVGGLCGPKAWMAPPPILNKNNRVPPFCVKSAGAAEAGGRLRPLTPGGSCEDLINVWHCDRSSRGEGGVTPFDGWGALKGDGAVKCANSNMFLILAHVAGDGGVWDH